MSSTEHTTTAAMSPASPSDPEPLTGAGALLGEGPVWDEETQRLLWVDIWSGLLNATSPEGETTSTDLGAPLSSVVLSARGTRVVTTGLCVLELTDEGACHLADIPEDPCMRANDAAVDPAGRLFPTSCAFGGPGLRHLFITTGSRPVAPTERPREVAHGAGALFRLSTGVRGLPTSRMEL